MSIRARDRLRDTTGDPWDGRTLEWATRSPPPAWNFARAAAGGRPRRVLGGQALPRRRAADRPTGEGGEPLEMPRPSAAGRRARVLRVHRRLRAGVAHLVAGARGPGRRRRRRAGARLADSSTSSRCRRPRSRRSRRGEPAHDARPTHDGRRGRDPDLRARAVAAQGDRRLRLLAVPAQRHHRVLGAVRGLRGAVGPHRRRPGRRAAVPPRQRAGRDGLPAVLELHLRHDVAGRSTCAGAAWMVLGAALTFALGAAFLVAGAARSSPA